MPINKSVIVRFYDTVPDEKIRFAVIVARCGNQWIFCRHQKRQTWEIPGGHRESGETMETAARRELMEETDAREFTLTPVGVYSVQGIDGPAQSTVESFGALYFADVRCLGGELHNEIACAQLFDTPPLAQTYPQIQPRLWAYVLEWLHTRNIS